MKASATILVIMLLYVVWNITHKANEYVNEKKVYNDSIQMYKKCCLKCNGVISRANKEGNINEKGELKK